MNTTDRKAGAVSSHFLDSGSFSLVGRAARFARGGGAGLRDYYDSEEFWRYVDDYAALVKRHEGGVDLYANVDVIPEPRLTWRSQKYLEREHGMSPVPVVHYRTDLKWLRHYIDRGHEVIGLGGLVGSMTRPSCVRWLDAVFDLVRTSPGRPPRVKLHGFGVSRFHVLLRYPWGSVDSTAWVKVGMFGGVLVPRRRKGDFDFSRPPLVVKVSDKSGQFRKIGKHFRSLTAAEREIIRAWLERVGVSMGGPGEEGVANSDLPRRAANLLYFEAMASGLPGGAVPVLYHSGLPGLAGGLPEQLLAGRPVAVMSSAAESRPALEKRVKRIVNHRKGAERVGSNGKS